MKHCKKCGEVKPLDKFSNCSANKDGKYNLCKDCKNTGNALSRRKISGSKGRKTILARFEGMFTPVPECGCWIWEGSTRGQGYGAFVLSDHERLAAHRASWVLYNGPIPDNCQVLHKCDVRRCVNPSHLFLGTHQDNMNDKVNKGRQAKGVQVPIAKLTESDVLAIRELAPTTSVKKLAERFGVSLASIQCVVGGKTWRHVMSG